VDPVSGEPRLNRRYTETPRSKRRGAFPRSTSRGVDFRRSGRESSQKGSPKRDGSSREEGRNGNSREQISAGDTEIVSGSANQPTGPPKMMSTAGSGEMEMSTEQKDAESPGNSMSNVARQFSFALDAASSAVGAGLQEYAEVMVGPEYSHGGASMRLTVDATCRLAETEANLFEGP